VHEREIAGAQPAVGGEGRGVGLGILEVAAGDIVAAHLQMPDPVLRQRPVLLIDDAHAAIRDRTPFGHELHRIARVRIHPLDGTAHAQAMPVEREGPHRRSGRREAHGERGLRETVHRIHGIARQAGGSEPRQELVAKLNRDRLRAVEDEPDAREIQSLDRALAEHLEVVLVAEVRRAEDARADAARERQPQQRPADEELRRHEVRVDAVVEHDEMEADQPHVVGERHPGETDVILREPRRLRRAARVGDDVAVRQHHALGLAGRARGELDEGDVLGRRLNGLAGAGDVIEIVDQEGARAQSLEGFRLPGLGGEGADPLERAALGIEEGPAELAGDAQELVPVLVADAERDGDRHDAAEHGGPEGVDELLVAAEEEDQLVAAARAETLQMVQDAERARMQLFEADITRVVLALEVGDLPGMAAIGL
jgi:hypothetical protein